MQIQNKEMNILQTAEEMVRKSGYNGFSFRNVADAVGIKSSSVHYYFPTKESLGAAVAKNYTDRFMTSLGEPDELARNKKDPIKVYVVAFRNALVQDKRMCLCGLLGAEVDGLPDAVVSQAQAFFKRNIEWLAKAYSLNETKMNSRKKAIRLLSLLEGAMITSKVLNDIKIFDQAVEEFTAK